MEQENLGEFISMEEAALYVSEFRKRNPDSIKAFQAGGDKLQQILAQENCIGIRIYNGYDQARGANNLVVIGIDSNLNDIDQGLILERFGFCPPMCGSGMLMQP